MLSKFYIVPFTDPVIGRMEIEVTQNYSDTWHCVVYRFADVDHPLAEASGPTVEQAFADLFKNFNVYVEKYTQMAALGTRFQEQREALSEGATPHDEAAI